MTAPKRTWVVGLVGGIGSGKSEVAAEMRRRGAKVISADEFGHEALRLPEVKDELVRRWGGHILGPEGEIDRRAVGAIVFADPREREALERVVFPHIERRIAEEIAAGMADPAVPLIVLDAAIMLEAGWGERCDWIVYVHADGAVRRERLRQTRGWTAKEVEQRTRAQMSLTDKVTRADFVIDNSADREHLRQEVDKLWQKLDNARYPSPKH